MWWTNDPKVGYTSILDCKEELGPKIETLKKAGLKDEAEKADKIYKTKMDPN